MEKEEENNIEQIEASGELIESIQLSQAVFNSKLMLAHATEQGLEIEQSLIDKVVEAKHLEKKQAWTQEKEAQFWGVYRNLAKLIQPVTIDSILAANEKKKHLSLLKRMLGIKAKATTLTRKAVQRHTRYALFSLFVMLILQIYSLIGTTILKNIADSDTEIQQIETEIRIQSKIEENKEAIVALEQNRNSIAKEREKNIELLAKWLRPIDLIILNEPADLSVFDKDDSKKTAEEFNQIIDLGIKVTQSAQHPILIISSYILPLLYGLLGAYAYVLRVLSSEIKHITYSKESDIKYILRINLGALAGLAVGLISGPESTKNLLAVNLPPLALAFIAGYSIEFVFTAIDKFIGGRKRDEKE